MKRLQRNQRRRLLVPLFTLALVAAACGGDTEGPEVGADVQDVTDEEPFDENEFFQDPEPFLGQEVTVSAEVNTVLTSTAFVIAGGDVPDLLVIGAQSPGDITENTVVRVTGTVVNFVIPDIERQFGIDLDDSLFVDYEQEHAIVASSVIILDPAEGEEALGEVTEEFSVNLQPLNGSAVEGTAELKVGADGRVQVSIDGRGLVPAQTHPQHIHMPSGDTNGTCPQPNADKDGDGMISVAEGQPSYGPVVLPLEPFPVATMEGEIDFEGTFTPDPGLTPLDQGVIVVHGADVDGQYNQQLPVACAEIM